MPDIIPNYSYTDIIPNIIPDIVPYIGPDVIQDGLVPPLEREAAGIISSSEAVLKAYATKHSLNASAINDLIKDVPKIQPSMQMKLILTCCSDCKRPLTAVTFRLLT